MTEEGEITLIASLENGSPATKTEMEVTNEGLSNAQYEVFWLPGDKITVFSSGASSIFTSRNTTKTKTAEFVGTGTFVISGGVEGEQTDNYIWGIYPSRSDLVYSVPEGMTYADATIQTTLPPIQKAKAGGFADDLAIMIGRARESLSMPFKNAYSGLWVRINGHNITSMTLRGNDNQTLAGKFTVGLNASQLPEVKSIDEPSQEITLYPENGCFEAGKYYYFITLPDVPLPNGYTVTLHRKDGMEGTFSISSNRTFDRNIFLGVSGYIDQRVNNWHASEAQAPNEIWYTTTDGNPITLNSANSAIADRVEENSYSDGKGVLRFNSTITEVPNEAFRVQTTLSSVTLPDMVTSVGYRAFLGCTSLKEVNLPDGITTIQDQAFQSCSFETIRLPESLQRIGQWAFAWNTCLKGITIPESVVMLGGNYYFNRNPFCGCTALQAFYGKFASDDHLSLLYTHSIYGDNYILASFALAGIEGGSYRIPDKVTVIAPFACAYAPFTQVDLNKVTTIYEGGFQGSKLTSLTIPSIVSYVGVNAFHSCEDMESISIETDGTRIPNGSQDMFSNTGDGPIFVPAAWIEVFKTAEYWSDYAGRYEPYLKNNQISYTASKQVNYYVNTSVYDNNSEHNVVVSNEYDANTNRGVITFENDLTYLDDGAFYDCQDLTGIILPETVKWIGKHAFYGCSNLSNVSLSKDLYLIGTLAFAECSSLEGIILPEGLVHIYDRAFMGSGLKSITLPESLIGLGVSDSNTYIDHTEPKNPFAGCSELRAFYGKYATGDHLYLVRKYGDETYLLSGTPAGIGTTASLPEVTYVADWALYGMAFNDVVIPETVSTLGAGSFQSCPNLKIVILSKNVSKISSLCFSECPSLEYIQLLGVTLPLISLDTFGVSDTNDSCPILICSTALSDQRLNDTDSEWYTYRNRIGVFQSADEIWYNAGRTQVGYYATPEEGSVLGFSGNVLSFVRSTTLPSDFLANSYPAVAFPEWGSNMPEIVILKYSENICKLGNDAYWGNANWYRDVDYTSLPVSISSIGARAFCCIDGMRKFPVPSIADLREIGEDAFNYCVSMEGDITLNNVTTIGKGAFKDCQSLQNIRIPHVETLGDSAFDMCTNLERLVLPEIKTIGEHAFAYTRAMTELRLGKNLQSIGDCVFYDDDDNLRSSLKLNIYFYGNPWPSGAWGSAFNYTDPSNTNPTGCFKFDKVYVSREYVDEDNPDFGQMTYSNFGTNTYWLPNGDIITDHLYQ